MPATEKAGARPGTHASALLAEADRLMTVCNSCRYCEGLCAVFPAMEMRRAFPDGDLNYLANLCHSCGACYVDCQFSPPHEFDVNVPRVLAQVRGESYAAYAWPRALAPLFARNGLAISIVAALSVAAFILGFVAWHDPGVLFGTHVGPGAFYRLMPHNAMAWLFGLAFVYAIVALMMGVRAFWGDIGDPMRLAPGAWWQAIRNAASLRYLDGGGIGCYNHDERPNDRRKFYHHLTFYGFALCFASTCVATLYHYLLGREAPYPWWDLPVVLGTVGGIGLIFGPIGLLIAKQRRDPEMTDEQASGMEVAFLVMLFLTSLTGLALLVLRATPAMPLLLALHLGVVFALFITMPYGKFVHGIYRFAALVRSAKESRGFVARDVRMSDLVGIPVIFMRGGTSRGPYFKAEDLPQDTAARDRVLLAAMGSPDPRQIDGLGGADTLTSKVAIVSKSTRPGVDVDYLFAQVDIGKPIVDTNPSCGNMLAGVAPFAIETGMIPANDGETHVMIYNVNTEARIEAVVQTPGRNVVYTGDARIDGVPGTAAPIILNFMDVVGSVSGKLLPTGNARDVIDGIEVSCIDVAMPMIMMRAKDLELTGYEGRPEINSNKALFARIEPIRLEAGRRMGFGDVSDKVIPKVGLLSPPRDGGTIASRYLTPHALHAAHAVTGAVCVASACALDGTIAHEVAKPDGANPRTIRIEHPSGQVDVRLEVRGKGADMEVVAGTLRTARPIMKGEVLVPRKLLQTSF